ncbi:MAG: VapC toxin family PIN domain ribonuclease [Acidobacteriia bacterium]|nr:VapC toxin family PIN domain ribonuclease [Terriglobia bacterium]
MTRLFDVNALIAIVEQSHPFHRPMHAWLQKHVGVTWATCPITENGFVRVLSQSSFQGQRRSPADSIELLRRVRQTPGWPHIFWPDDYSISEPSSINAALVPGHNQITDVYLVALALRKGGRLLTFDRRTAWQCVPGATASIIEIPPA